MQSERPPRQMRPLIDDALQGRLRDFAHVKGVPVRRVVNEAVHRFLHQHETAANEDEHHVVGPLSFGGLTAQEKSDRGAGR